MTLKEWQESVDVKIDTIKGNTYWYYVRAYRNPVNNMEELPETPDELRLAKLLHDYEE